MTPKATFPASSRRLVPLQLVGQFGDVEVSDAIWMALSLSRETTWGYFEGRPWTHMDWAKQEVVIDSFAASLRPRVDPRHLEIPDLQVFPGLGNLDSLDLSNRAHNSLRRAMHQRGLKLFQLSARDLCILPQFGSTTLVEILSASDDYFEGSFDVVTLADLRRINLRPRLTIPPVLNDGSEKRDAADLRTRADEPTRVSEAQVTRFSAVMDQEWVTDVHLDDPIFTDQLDSGASSAMSIAEFAARVVDSGTSTQSPENLEELLNHLETLADRRAAMTADEEFEVIVQKLGVSDEKLEILAARLGLTGDGPKTLDEVGRSKSITRERVRQVEKEIRRKLLRQRIWMPRLEEAIGRLSDLAPRPVDFADRDLRSQGLLSPNGTSLALLRISEFLERETGLVVSEQLILGTDHAGLPQEIRQTVGKLTEHYGCTNVPELTARLGFPESDEEMVRSLVSKDPELVWLDTQQEFLWMRSRARNRLLNQAEKIMSVAGSCELAALRDGISRHHRMRAIRPPQEVLANLLVSSGLYERDGDQIVAGRELPAWQTVLPASERAIAEVLFEQGPLMTRADLRRVLVHEQGMNSNSFAIYLSYSPIIQRFSTGVFGLRGSQINAADLMAFKEEVVLSKKKVLLDSGWSRNGQAWVAYRLSAASLDSAVFSMPASFSGVLEGSFTVVYEGEEERPLGSLRIRGSEKNFWGLGPLFRRKRPEEGDCLVVAFDLQQGIATAHLGSEEIIADFEA